MQTAFSPSQSRFPLLDPATVTDATVRAVYAEIERELGFGIVPNLFRAMGNQPAVLRATWDLFRATVLQGRLPRIVKEMVGIVVSKANNSEYALKVHMHSLGVQGVAESVLAALASGSDNPQGVAPSIAAIIKVAYKAAYHGPLSIDEADMTLLAREGLTPGEIGEVFAAIDLFRYVNGFTDLVRVPVDAL